VADAGEKANLRAQVLGVSGESWQKGSLSPLFPPASLCVCFISLFPSMISSTNSAEGYRFQMEFHLFEPDLHAKTSGEVGDLSISGKQCQRQRLFALLIEDFDRSTPAFSLTGIDLSKVEHLPLDHLATPAEPILHHSPIAMLFAVFDPRITPQEHYGHRFYS
jgi:hypothetical protein